MWRPKSRAWKILRSGSGRSSPKCRSGLCQPGSRSGREASQLIVFGVVSQLARSNFLQGVHMQDQSSRKFGSMDRRQMLGTTLVRGAAAVALQSHLAFGAEKANAPAPAVRPVASTGNPNLNPPVVSVKGGKLRGLREGKTFSFLGIRYAEAERFGQPKAVQAWEGVKSAQVYGAVCPSPIPTAVSGDELVFPHRFWTANENCQYLNVWTQNLTPATKKPVMVWMHGGGFTNGSSMEGYAYDGRSLSEFGDVVVVSVN